MQCLKRLKIKIGISLRIVEERNYKEKRDALSHDWIKFLEPLDMMPILIPNNLKNVNLFLEEMGIDHIILSGGDNIGDDPLRDKTEKEIIKFGIKNKIPIFGVCRGMQVINKFFGGDTKINSNSDHVGKNHPVILEDNFSEFLHSKSVVVNSFHNNIITNTNIGAELIPFAYSKDDTIEGFCHKTLPIMGVMWHPERDTNMNNQMILKNFFTEKN